MLKSRIFFPHFYKHMPYPFTHSSCWSLLFSKVAFKWYLGYIGSVLEASWSIQYTKNGVSNTFTGSKYKPVVSREKQTFYLVFCVTEKCIGPKQACSFTRESDSILYSEVELPNPKCCSLENLMLPFKNKQQTSWWKSGPCQESYSSEDRELHILQKPSKALAFRYCVQAHISEQLLMLS